MYKRSQSEIMRKPKVSIITPVYNNPLFLKEVIESVQNQTFKDWEHIIVDDGSTNPETQSVVEDLIVNYPKVSAYRIKNGGPGAARNFGIKKALGEYIFTFDDDDRINENLLSEAVIILDDKQSVGVVTTWIQSFGNGYALFKPSGGDVTDFLISNNACGNSLFRKSLWERVGGYDEARNLIGYEDWEFWIRCTSTGYKVHVIEKPYFLYRIKNKKLSLHKLANDRHLQLFEYIVNKNKEIYSRNVVSAMLKYEEKIIALRGEANIRFINNLKSIIRKIFQVIKS